MIGKIAKMKDGIVAKIILSLTALSFVSLFGVSSYINSANSNKTVIKVGKDEVSQSEFNHELQKKLTKYRNSGLLTDDEDTALRNALIHDLAQEKVQELIIDNVMRKYNIDFRPDIVRAIIFSSPQFLDEKGQFDRQMYNWYLNRNALDENDVIKQIKNNLARKVLVDLQTAYTKLPEVLIKQMQKVVGQRRTFKYVKIENEKAKITRQPTENELDQYYEDLDDEFIIPETRDISVMFLSLDDIEKNMEVTPEEVEAYYKEHIEEYEQPEKRDVLQMVFDTREEADIASAKLTAGEDFMKVAEENGQTAADVELGLVARSDLSDELADIVFDMKVGAPSKPIEIADSWQILKVKDTKAAQKISRATADAIIADEIRQEKAYDGSYELISAIEDKLGEGISLEDVAKEFNANIYAIKGVSEEGKADNIPVNIKDLLQNKDIIDTAFLYNKGEIGQSVEDESGLAVVRVDAVTEEHKLPREDADKRLKELWVEDEKASVTQETADNVEHDLEMGDSLYQVASRYGLQVINTMPINRSEQFADLPAASMKELFALGLDDVKVLKNNDDFIIAQVSNIYDDSASMSLEDKNFLVQALSEEQAREMHDALLQAFGSEFKVEVHYNRMGISEE